MSTIFNAFEVFEMAEQIERNGIRFYRKAAANFKDSDAHSTLLELVDWEKEHEATFAAMKKELSEQQGHLTDFDPEDEAVLYLKVIADGHVFNIKGDSSEQLTGKESLEDIYKIALGLEKDSIVFLLALKELVSPDAGKNKVEAIIKEEVCHTAILNQKLAALK